ncbi:hypothetical protein MAPG_08810 [Magnaporthiopsis poae ATCC 64411]|uniref:Uncharacterized protein n=1 Tax=Magnaporthiopsis poae (strain ATCC 64411 / 73-15) TaxID=644358 RepID=A0A0C4E8B0_MAGP6|nr:hypothetical protein MAPG_08810 [Magnaporthiopsis poae ATCC 64411]
MAPYSNYQAPATANTANVAWATYQAPSTTSYSHNTSPTGYQTTVSRYGGNLATSVHQAPGTGYYSITAPAAYQTPATPYASDPATTAYQAPATGTYESPGMAAAVTYDNTTMTGTEYVEMASAEQVPMETQQHTGAMTQRASSTNTAMYAPDRPISPAESEATVIYAPSGGQQARETSSQEVSDRARGKLPETSGGQEVSRTARSNPPDRIPIPESSSDLVQIPSLPAAHYQPVRMRQAVSRALLARRDRQGLTAVYPDRLPPDRYLRTHTRFTTSVKLLIPGSTQMVELLDYEIQVGGGLIINLVWGERSAPIAPAHLVRAEYEYTAQLGIDTVSHVTFMDVVYLRVKAMVLAAMVATGKDPDGRHVFTPEGLGWDEIRRGNSLMVLAEQAVGRPAVSVEVEGLYMNTPYMKLDDMTVWF